MMWIQYLVLAVLFLFIVLLIRAYGRAKERDLKRELNAAHEALRETSKKLEQFKEINKAKGLEEEKR